MYRFRRCNYEFSNFVDWRYLELEHFQYLAMDSVVDKPVEIDISSVDERTVVDLDRMYETFVDVMI